MEFRDCFPGSGTAIEGGGVQALRQREGSGVQLGRRGEGNDRRQKARLETGQGASNRGAGGLNLTRGCCSRPWPRLAESDSCSLLLIDWNPR